MNRFLRMWWLFLSFTQVCQLCWWVGVCSAELRVGFVFDKGGKNDRSFNSSAYEGAMKVKSDLKAFVKYVEATDDNAFDSLIRDFARKNFDLIISIGASQEEAVKKISTQFPDRHFAILDGQVKAPNVKSVLFQEHEGSYLVGALAALVSKSGKIGFLGGMDIPLIHRFSLGYFEGAKKVRPDIKTASNYVGVTAEAWNNPVKAKELAVSQYDSGVDVIFAAAGGSGTGLFDAAEEKQKLAIGVDSNQNGLKPGFVLTSMVKKIDEAVYVICKDFTEGKFVAGVETMGLKNKGVDYVIDSSNEKLIKPDVRKKVEELKAKIIAGEIKVPDYYLKRK